MLISLHDSGVISEVIPKPGQSISECLLEELEVSGLSELEYFVPRLLRGRNDEKDGVCVMLGRRHHTPTEKENYVADIITGLPDLRWCYGTYIIVYQRGSELVDIPKESVTVFANVAQTVSEMTMKEN